jgi:hypothetical protein
VDPDDELLALLSKHSLDAHLLGRLQAHQLRELHAGFVEVMRARRPNAEGDPEALARAIHAAETTLECLEAHPSVVSAAADRLLADAPEIDAATGDTTLQRPPVAASKHTTRKPDLRPRERARATVSNVVTPTGQRVTADELGELILGAVSDLRHNGAARRVATIEASSQATRLGADEHYNERLISSAVAEQKNIIRASGGSCSPSAALYDMPTIAVDSRPVRDSLPQFVVDRGGIRFQPPPTLGDVADAWASGRMPPT